MFTFTTAVVVGVIAVSGGAYYYFKKTPSPTDNIDNKGTK